MQPTTTVHDTGDYVTPVLAKTFCNSSLVFKRLVPVLHDWGNKGHGMCYAVCGMVHIK